MTTVSGDTVVNAARRYLGTPFMHQGRMVGIGVDCAGVLTCVAYDLGLKDVRISDYGRLPDPERAKQIIEAHMDPIPFSDLSLGDVLSFVILRDVQHYGVLTQTDSMRFLHAYETVGRVVETSLVGPWLKRLRNCYRFRGVA